MKGNAVTTTKQDAGFPYKVRFFIIIIIIVSIDNRFL